MDRRRCLDIQKPRNSGIIFCPACGNIGAVFGDEEWMIHNSDWYLWDHTIRLKCICGYMWDEYLTPHFASMPRLTKEERKLIGTDGYYRTVKEAQSDIRPDEEWGTKIRPITARTEFKIYPTYAPNGRKYPGSVDNKGRPIDHDLRMYLQTNREMKNMNYELGDTTIGFTCDQTEKAYLKAYDLWVKDGERYPLYLYEQLVLGIIEDMDELRLCHRAQKEMEDENEKKNKF